MGMYFLFVWLLVIFFSLTFLSPPLSWLLSNQSKIEHSIGRIFITLGKSLELQILDNQLLGTYILKRKEEV